MTVCKSINFNGIEVFTCATVIEEHADAYLVRFYHEGVEFRGMWQKRDIVTTIT